MNTTATVARQHQLKPTQGALGLEHARAKADLSPGLVLARHARNASMQKACILRVCSHELQQRKPAVLTIAILQREDLRDRLLHLFGSRDLHRATTAMDQANSVM